MTAPRRQLFCFPPPLAAREKWPKSDFGRKLAGHLTGRKRGDGYSACKRSPSRAYAVTRPSTPPFKEPTNAKVIPGGCEIFAPGDTLEQPRKRIIARPRSVAARTPLLCLLFFFFSRERAATLHPPPLLFVLNFNQVPPPHSVSLARSLWLFLVRKGRHTCSGGGCDSCGGGAAGGVRVGDRKREEFKLIDPRHLIRIQREGERQAT